MKKQIRYLREMEKVVFDKNFARELPDLKLYYIHRGVKKENGIRYDTTVIPSQMLGKEFVKTKGNRNSNNFPELYTVLTGEAIFLMQKAKPSSAKASEPKGEIEDVFVVKAKKGDYVIVPPKYAVITINPSNKILKLGNWVSEKNKNIYEELEKMKGACYYYTKSGWIKNENYKKIPKLRFEKPLKEKPKNLHFLK